METKRVAIPIKLASGNLNVKGAHHKLWIENYFNSVRECVDILTQAKAHPENLTENPVCEERAKNEKETIDETRKSTTTETEKEKLSEIELLWQENTNLKRALKTIESALTSKYSCQYKDTNIETLTKDLDEKIFKAEERLDAKIVLFSEVMEKLFNKKIESLQ